MYSCKTEINKFGKLPSNRLAHDMLSAVQLFTFTHVAHTSFLILFTYVKPAKFTSVRTYNLRDSGNPPLDKTANFQFLADDGKSFQKFLDFAGT